MRGVRRPRKLDSEPLQVYTEDSHDDVSSSLSSSEARRMFRNRGRERPRKLMEDSDSLTDEIKESDSLANELS
jgi:hypothetical protein